MTSERECYVYVVPPGATDFVTAARFRWLPSSEGLAIGRFVYGKKYLSRKDAVELDPVELRLGSQEFETTRLGGFFGAIRDSMPDFWGRRVIERNAHGIVDELDYLLLGPDDRAGALGFGPNLEPPAPLRKFNRVLDLARLRAAAEAVLSQEPDVAGSAGRQVEELLLLGTSMGGARPKAVVEHERSLWIAKFSHPNDRWNQPRVEHALLELSRKLGMSTAESRIESVAGKDVLLVRRFDREKANKGYRRHRMVSALTLLRAEDSATDRRRWSYLLLADELRRASAAPREDLRELFTRVCFNAAISNLDDHPRNHAVLAENLSWRLSPAYDLTPSPVIASDRRDLAMACGHEGRYANRANILSGAQRFFLDEEEAAEIFDRIAKSVRTRWRSTFRSVGVSETDCETVARAFVYDGLDQ